MSCIWFWRKMRRITLDAWNETNYGLMWLELDKLGAIFHLSTFTKYVNILLFNVKLYMSRRSDI